MLSGNLSDWPVTDLLQIMKVTQKTGALRIDGSRPGVVHFVNGQIAGATSGGQRPPGKGDDARRSAVDALHVLVANVDGSFLVGDPEVGDSAPRWDVAEIMSEVDRLRIIESDIRREGIDETTHLRLATGTASPVTLHAEDWEALVALVPSFSLASLGASLGRSRALAVVATLVSRGLTAPDETMFAIESELPAITLKEPPPVLDWLSEQPAESDVDLSTDITSPRAIEDEAIEEVAARRRSLRGVVASPGMTLVSGVLNDMRKLRTNNG
ncbi:MAG: DUF4388 domain-containing protein [Acidimicrobiia bacterium]|nr:DUF4388 domain-containing protein [Acidimicrobiia bacterium]